MAMTLGFLAGFFAAGVASKLGVTASPFDSEGIRTHLFALFALVIVFSLAIPFVDMKYNPALNFQQVGIETAVLVGLAYVIGLAAGYVGDIIQDIAG